MPYPHLRSKLFVPGARPELFAKALASAADALSFDLEDSVPESGKDRARAAVAEMLASLDGQRPRPLVIVRPNAWGSRHFEADLAAVVRPGVALINLPKPESAADVVAALAVLERIEEANGIDRPVAVLANIETPMALRRAAEIGGAHPRVVGLQLGLGDLFEPLGIDRRDPVNVHAAMFAVRMAAGEAGVFAVDGAYADVADPAGYRREAEMAQRLGFVGKSCIHPSQIATANEVFASDVDDLDEARRIVAAAGDARALDHGAFLFEGRMVDAPFLRRAEAVIAAADRDGR